MIAGILLFAALVFISGLMMIFQVGSWWLELLPIGIGFLLAVIMAVSARDVNKVEKEESKKPEGDSKETPEPPKEEKKEEPKKVVDEKKHPWQQEPKGFGFGSLVFVILAIAASVYFFSDGNVKSIIYKPDQDNIQRSVEKKTTSRTPEEEERRRLEAVERAKNLKRASDGNFYINGQNIGPDQPAACYVD